MQTCSAAPRCRKIIWIGTRQNWIAFNRLDHDQISLYEASSSNVTLNCIVPAAGARAGHQRRNPGLRRGRRATRTKTNRVTQARPPAAFLSAAVLFRRPSSTSSGGERRHAPDHGHVLFPSAVQPSESAEKVLPAAACLGDFVNPVPLEEWTERPVINVFNVP